jgi:hypothetical protein
MYFNGTKKYFLTLALGISVAPAYGQTSEEILNYSGPNRENYLLSGAERESEVVLYSAMIVNQAVRPLAEAFQKKYQKVKLNYWRGDANEIPRRIMAEVQARNVVADVVEGTSTAVSLAKANALQAFSSPIIEEYEQIHRDPNHLWAATRLSYYCSSININMVSKSDAPKTYEDLLDPKWKGKLSWRMGVDNGPPLFITNLRLAWGEDRARGFFEKLASQNIVNFGAGSARTLVDRVIAGEYPIALNIFCHHPLISANKGAPVASQLMDPMVSTAGNVVIPKGIKHPYGAMLFIDYLLSQEGQNILSAAEYYPAHPKVRALNYIDAIVPRVTGIHENFVRPEDEVRLGEKSTQIFEEIFRR